MYTVKPLPSGLPVLTVPSDGTASVTVMVFAGAGSRYEKEKERGISHFLEHMFFKGGKKYPSTKAVSVAIDRVGGEFNAFTGKEYAGYYVKIAAEHAELACDVLSDMLVHAVFPKEDIERERGVIIEEDRMYQDTPMYRAGWDFEELLYGDHPLGWDTIGTHKVIKSVQQKDFRAHKDLLYTPDNLVLTFAGRIEEKQAQELASRFFRAIAGRKKRVFAPLETYGKKRVFLRKKKTEQSHLVLGVPGVPSLHDDHFAHKLLAVILGGNMSSRMFLNIREAKGMCYYIDTDTDGYLDAGALTTRAGVDQSRLTEAIKLIRHEYDVCAAKGVTTEELSRAKSFARPQIALPMEHTEHLAHFYGKQQLLYPAVLTVAEYFRKLDGVTKERVNALAARLLRPEQLRLVVIGRGAVEEDLERLLH